MKNIIYNYSLPISYSMIHDTKHQLYLSDPAQLHTIADSSIQLVITSPPYPMIEMWDELFTQKDPTIGQALHSNEGQAAFELMHHYLDTVWQELYRTLSIGGIACINIGDATRRLNNNFSMYPNHSRIMWSFTQLGFFPLPPIIWRKQSNAPNKFMGSGMLPPGAYVTHEHEYILIFRKGMKREFTTAEEKKWRQESAYFWEERNQWFSDMWEIREGRHKLLHHITRNRNTSFPFEIAHRLINMYSLQHDTILDPFIGSGTSMLAAMANQRNSIGITHDEHNIHSSLDHIHHALPQLNVFTIDRIKKHINFTNERIQNGKNISHTHTHLQFPVITRQEIDIQFAQIHSLSHKENTLIAAYQPLQKELSPIQTIMTPYTDSNNKIFINDFGQLTFY